MPMICPGKRGGDIGIMSGSSHYFVLPVFFKFIINVPSLLHEERAFILKFSAMEIYNEVVRDLLSTDNAQLRLLDDPEKGTIIEKLTEETLRGWDHLKELLSICEVSPLLIGMDQNFPQRQIGETLLNEKSSRSHQILRLTIESSAREFLGKSNSTTLAASVVEQSRMSCSITETQSSHAYCSLPWEAMQEQPLFAP